MCCLSSFVLQKVEGDRVATWEAQCWRPRGDAWRVSSTINRQLLYRSSASCQFKSTVGFQESLINGVRQTRQGSLPVPLQPTADGPSVNCATRWNMSLAEAVEVLNATVKEAGAKYEKGCKLLSSDLSNVIEVRSCHKGKETRDG